jgi:hypothetical protein
VGPHFGFAMCNWRSSRDSNWKGANNCYIITLMISLTRRMVRLEAQRPVKPRPSRVLQLSDLDPEVAAMFIARDYDVNRMNLAELDVLAAELGRLTV